MKRPGYDATRRNRNIGTSKQGHGQNNRDGIPDPWWDWRYYYEKLKDPVILPCKVHQEELTVIVEPTLPDYFHASTVDDVLRVLSLLPPAHTAEIDLIVLRQPTRKQKRFAPVWGRLCYWVDIGKYTGPCIYLEAQPRERTSRWGKRLDCDDRDELERLREDGHDVVNDKRGYTITSPPGAIRATQLYRTLPHEVGHYVHLLSHQEEARQLPPAERDDYEERYWQKASKEKEAFAHRYADEARARFRKLGQIPFPQIRNLTRMKEQGLKAEWFEELDTEGTGLA